MAGATVGLPHLRPVRPPHPPRHPEAPRQGALPASRASSTAAVAVAAYPSTGSRGPSTRSQTRPASPRGTMAGQTAASRRGPDGSGAGGEDVGWEGG